MKRNFGKNGYFILSAAAILIAAAFGVFEVVEERRVLTSLVDESYRNLSAAMRQAQSGDPIAAGRSINLSLNNIGKLNDNYFSKLIPFFSGGPDLSGVLSELGGAAASATRAKDDISSEFPVAIFTDGLRAREIIDSLYKTIDRIIALSSSFRNQASAINAFSGSDYLAVQSDLEAAKKALAEGAGFMSEDGEVLFILIDEREATPYGGRPVSGALIPFRGGRIIAEEAKAVPRNLLEVREAAEMLDFAAAANKIAAGFGAEGRLKAVVALNFAAFKKVLLLTGPAELPEERAVLDAQNAGEVIATDKEGDVFAAAFPALSSGIEYLPDARRENFSREIRGILERRDMQIYFSDRRIPLLEGGDGFAAGDDYLAVFGSFTETESASLRAKIEANVDLYSDGSSYGKVVVTRAAPAALKGDVHWRLLFPKEMSVESMSGEELQQEIVDGVSPELSIFGYETKEGIFAAEYRRKAGRVGRYRLIYDRQPGADVRLSIRITAPAEYVFAETGRGEYVYESDDPPGRLIINLSAVKLR